METEAPTDTVDTVYTVALCDYPDLPPKERMAAEVRYCKALEKALGGSNAVAATYRAWTSAVESEASELNTAIASEAVRWPKASDAARQAGLRDLGEPQEAYFEVRLT